MVKVIITPSAIEDAEAIFSYYEASNKTNTNKNKHEKKNFTIFADANPLRRYQ
jgi:plasmid stabilization system protein ParE